MAIRPNLRWDYYALLMLAAVIIIGSFDAVATIYFTEIHQATEANPVMAVCLDRGTSFFFFIKMFLTCCSAIFLYHQRYYLLGKIGIIFCFTSMALLLLWWLHHLI